ncbi:hemerythrin domain-containing protein [Chitinimonas sp. BJB300]|uniref:hemerythrin domain-containing protein n=1 Tax=Chitinimonas sp. BJB300 TaxID=1559339 RepID=UPI000C11A88D|nr:hemerythrin domain-containing protein [Chitinimonas sp. BJB300]PHV10148.1 hypothetical protein CSQ89_17735 [Chitinimonas sp. BJB300]TSJ86129.1 hemerythrin domain-containing protein [Chitinimonas sp. BJB300]
MSRDNSPYDPLNSADARLAVFRLLMDDHQRLKNGFHEFAYLSVPEREEIGPLLMEEMCDLLEIYAAVEEDIFYPAVRAYLSEPGLVDEGVIEHLTLRVLVAELRDISSRQLGQCDAVFSVLGEYVRQHIHKEMNRMFTQLRQTGPDWMQMLAAMEERREELETQLEAEQRYTTNGNTFILFESDTSKTVLH